MRHTPRWLVRAMHDIRGLAPLALLIASTFAGATLAQERSTASAQSAPPGVRTFRVAGGLIMDGGQWRAVRDTSRRLTLTIGESEKIMLREPGRFLAIGALEGDDIVGSSTTRGAGSPPGTDSGATVGPLRARFFGPTTLAIAERDPGAPEAERWELVRTVRNEVPGFGDYVHVEILPEVIERVPPEYPEEARRARIKGTVMVQAKVATDGSVIETRVVKSIPELDGAAQACVKRWRFKPALAGGKPIAIWVAVPVKFKLP